jgi:anti-sigma regulatory factor (Ser/Thr protein kinase)
VRLVVESRPESVTLVRSMLAAFAEAAAIDEGHHNALRTSISEASNNVVVHAYPDTGPLSVALASWDSCVDVLVEDHGGGIHRVIPSNDRMGLGMAVISSLADRAEFSHGPEGGTQVHLVFGQGQAATLGRKAPDHLPEPDALTGDVVVSVEPGALLGPVLGRLSRAVAAQSHFPVNVIPLLSDVTDALADIVNSLIDVDADAVHFSISPSPHRQRLCIGPLPAGTAQSAADELDPRALGDLVDDVTVEDREGGDFICVSVVDGSGR